MEGEGGGGGRGRKGVHSWEMNDVSCPDGPFPPSFGSKRVSKESAYRR